MANWIWSIIGAVAAIVVFIVAYKVFGIDRIKSWLLWAVTEAEKDFGGGTGKLKLAFVYDMFMKKFPKLQVIVPYKLFTVLVDEALIIMKEMLKNEKISEIIVQK